MEALDLRKQKLDAEAPKNKTAAVSALRLVFDFLY